MKNTLTLKISFLILLNFAIFPISNVLAQDNFISGKITTQNGIGIAGALSKLKSSFGYDDDKYYSTEILSDGNGTFQIPIDWQEVKKTNDKGAKWWRVVVTKEDFITNYANVTLINGRINPNSFHIKLSPQSIINKYADKIKKCITSSDQGKSLIFLEFMNIKEIETNQMIEFMDLLLQKINIDVINELETYDCHTTIEPIFLKCFEIPIKEKEEAYIVASHLKFPGVIWGALEEDRTNNIYSSRMKFGTLVLEEPYHYLTRLSYSNDHNVLVDEISKEQQNPVNMEYAAFTYFIIGMDYKSENKESKAQKCLNRALKIKIENGDEKKSPLPKKIIEEIEQALSELKDATKNLEPIGK